MTEITPQYPSQSHDFKKGAKGSVVVLFFMFVDAPLNVRHGKRRGQTELLQAGKKSLQFLFALPNCFGTRNIINV